MRKSITKAFSLLLAVVVLLCAVPFAGTYGECKNQWCLHLYRQEQ